jgi:hypothetical protein
VSALTCLRDFEMAVFPFTAQAHGHQSSQAGIVCQAGRAADPGTQVQTVKRGSAARL